MDKTQLEALIRQVLAEKLGGNPVKFFSPAYRMTEADRLDTGNPADRVFAWCDGLKEVILDEGITQISEYMFETDNEAKDKLETLRLPTTLRVIAGDGFNNRKAFWAYLAPDMENPNRSKLRSILNHGTGLASYKVTYMDGKLAFDRI